MAKEFSPEEKLLNLIKKKKKPEAAPVQETTRVEGSAPEMVEAPAKEKAVRISQPAVSFGGIANFENIKTLNTALFAMLILIILYVFVDIFFIPPKEIRVTGIDEKKYARSVDEIDVRPYSYYSQEMRSKKVFRPSITQERTKSFAPEIIAEEIIGNLTLLGIVTGEVPQAIIEDKKLKKSFFLKEGQSTGGVLLKKIDEGSVTVVYRGEEFNLSL
ncbi:MAG: hypothetical protein V3S04_05265 [Candidatus Omnitrophota bacterium]